MSDLKELADWLDWGWRVDRESQWVAGSSSLSQAAAIIRRLADSQDEGRELVVELAERDKGSTFYGTFYDWSEVPVVHRTRWQLSNDCAALLTKLLELDA